MDANEEFIAKLNRDLPELVEVKHLVQAGVYRHEQAAYMARQKGDCPRFIRIPHRGIVYPKKGVLEFLQKQSSHQSSDASISHSKPSWQSNKSSAISKGV